MTAYFSLHNTEKSMAFHANRRPLALRKWFPQSMLRCMNLATSLTWTFRDGTVGCAHDFLPYKGTFEAKKLDIMILHIIQPLKCKMLLGDPCRGDAGLITLGRRNGPDAEVAGISWDFAEFANASASCNRTFCICRRRCSLKFRSLGALMMQSRAYLALQMTLALDNYTVCFTGARSLRNQFWISFCTCGEQKWLLDRKTLSMCCICYHFLFDPFFGHSSIRVATVHSGLFRTSTPWTSIPTTLAPQKMLGQPGATMPKTNACPPLVESLEMKVKFQFYYLGGVFHRTHHMQEASAWACASSGRLEWCKTIFRIKCCPRIILFLCLWRYDFCHALNKILNCPFQILDIFLFVQS